MLYRFIRILLYPLIRFILPFFSLKAKTRLDFELSNVNSNDVDIIFHVSSEGELEQCYPLLLDYLKENRVLLLFTSISVLGKAKSLSKSHKDLFIEAKRVVSYFPFFNKGIYKYKSIKKFFMVRYDFFPELIDYSYKHNSTLLNGSLINKENLTGISKYLLRRSLLSFNEIIYASSFEESRFKKMNISARSFSFDLRSLRILERKASAKNVLEKTFNNFFDFEAIGFKNIVVLGSYWNSEFLMLKKAILNSIENHDLIFIAPHSLKLCTDIKESFLSNGINCVVADQSTDFSTLYKEAFENKLVVILNAAGVLCELYSICNHAYIAGGWHKSIHSVLEPFLMNERVFISCGPNVSRSTEFELVRSIDPNRVSSFDSIDKFEFLGENYKTTSFDVVDTYSKLKDFIR